jgi:hypothetical protein
MQRRQARQVNLERDDRSQERIEKESIATASG